ncbi:cytochrome P450 family protein [Streptomyces profundus]|uniref:cytochrome P450 family protein n=1 Tax=Streptomyces profundus TaxID=2867410 RepID=UPI001D167388|nr:cytochrome P450 [Streptomyces sp. MA3_2.13]UED85081.1 cytochrome P450 [Streptomyces sp. MA3_2.13]
MSSTRPLSKYWMLTNEFTQNPYPMLEHLRAERPVTEFPLPDGQRMWVVTRHADAKVALSDTRLSRDIHLQYEQMSKEAGRTILPPPEEANHLANLDPPRHTPLRKAISFAFTPKRTESMRARVEEVSDELIDRMTGQPADLIEGFADPLPVIIIAELMGVPTHMWSEFLRWSVALHTHFAADPSAVADRQANIRELSDYLSGLIEEKEKEPGDDLLSALIHADEDRRLTRIEILSTAFALMSGGNETTATLLGGVLATLLTHPAERERLLADPKSWKSSMDELVRFVNPLTTSLQRVTTAPVEIGGVEIPAGETVVVSVLSANRDEEQFPGCPHKLDLDRPKPAQMSFGFGIHYCSGAHLAKLITEVGTRRMFARRPEIKLAVDPSELRYLQRIGVRPLERLPVVW